MPEHDDQPGEAGASPEPAVPSPLRDDDVSGSGVPGVSEQPPPVPRRGAKITALVTAIVVAVAGAAVAIVLRSADRGAHLEDVVPAGAIAFGRAVIGPTGDQRDHIEGILDKFPRTKGRDVGEQIDSLLQEGFAEGDIDYADDIKPWLGAEIGFAVYRVSVGGAVPQVQFAVLIAVRDEGGARTGLEKLKGVQGEFVYKVQQGAAFLAPDNRSLTAALRVVNGDAQPLTTNADYVALRDKVGADSVGLFWADAGPLAAVIPPQLLPQIPGANLSGKTIVGLRAGENRAEIIGYSIEQKQQPKTGRTALVEGSSADQLGSLTLFDIAGLFERGIDTFGLLLQFADPFGTANAAYFPQESSPFFPESVNPRRQVEQALQQLLGLSLERDVLPWLHGEFSIVVGGFPSGPIPAAGVLIESTDDEAAQRTMRALRDRLGFLGASAGFDVTPAPGGFAIAFQQGITVVVRRAEGRVVIASSDAYADELLGRAGNSLAEDAVYRSVMGGTGDDVGFQLFVRMDELTKLLETFLPPDEFDEGEPYLRPFEAIGMRATAKGEDAQFRMVVTFR